MASTCEDVRVHIRWMVRRDLLEVVQTERASFGEPWSEEDFLRHLRDRACIGMVAEWGGLVAGYMVYLMNREDLTLLNLAVLPDCRRSGVATQMVEKLKGKLHSHRRTRLLVEVPDANLPAHLFFRKCGFTGEVKPGGNDVYRFVYECREASSVHPYLVP